MAWRFRRSLKLGPLPLNFSKSGIGYSAGVRGFRVGQDAKGRTYTAASIPGTGLYNRQYSGVSKPIAQSAASPTSAPPQSRTGNGLKLNSVDLRWSVISLILPGCAALLTLPFADLAFNDDWAYMHIALRYAQSGSIQYNGWNEPMLIFQAVYGGLLIRLFGFSFDLLRLATIPVGAGCSVLIYLLCRRADLPPPVSLFASLTATISPLFLPYATSFMTDAYGCFFFLFCVFLGIKAIDSVKPLNTSMWLIASIVIGLMGGADRQICWVGPFAVLVCFAWQKRKRPFLRFLAALLAILYVVAIVELLRWYGRQPSALIAVPVWQDIGNARSFLRFTVQYFLSAILFCLPSLLLFFPSLTQLSPRRLRLSLTAALTCTSIGLLSPSLLAPWLINTVTIYGVLLPNEELLGDKPVVLGIVCRVVLTTCVFFFSFVLGQIAILGISRARLASLKTAVSEATRTQTLVTLLTVSMLGCLCLVTARGLMGAVWDDYLLPWLPLFLILLCRMLFRPGMEPQWKFGCIALVVFAAYGIAATHDTYAALRAGIQATDKLEATGVPRRQIDGGLEYDTWTQLMATGYLCVSDARPPSGGSVCPMPPEGVIPGQYLRVLTPVVDPRYFLSFSDPQYFLAFPSVPRFVPSGFAPVSFRVWLPPFRRQVFILTHEAR